MNREMGCIGICRDLYTIDYEIIILNAILSRLKAFIFFIVYFIPILYCNFYLHS